MTDQYPRTNPEELIQDETINQQMEVFARTLDMIPARSDLGKYLAEPARVLARDAQGRSVVETIDSSNLDVIKTDTAVALEEFKAGKVAMIPLVHGSVNGHWDAHRGSGLKNMRAAFEQFAHFNVTGNTDFHQMFNPSGKTEGNLHLSGRGQEVSDKAVRMLASAAGKILDGENAVMFTGFEDKPQYKMYGITNPQTGERMPNTFMLINSGTYSDKNGTGSNFSNLAGSELVLIPSAAIEATKQPVDQEKSAFDIDKVDWNLFHGDFRVRRTSGAVDKTGWHINKVVESNGVWVAEIASMHGTKTIPVERLVAWQSPGKEEEEEEEER